MDYYLFYIKLFNMLKKKINLHFYVKGRIVSQIFPPLFIIDYL